MIKDASIENQTTGSEGAKSPQMTAADLSFLKDLGDIARTRSMFFIPFFGAFLAFLVAKSQYILDAGIVIQLEAMVTFALGVFYASVLFNYLWLLEQMRFLYGVKLSPVLRPAFEVTPELNSAFVHAGKVLQTNMTFEPRVFKWVMLSLWLTTFSTLFEMFFGKFFSAWLTPVAVRWLTPLIEKVFSH